MRRLAGRYTCLQQPECSCDNGNDGSATCAVALQVSFVEVCVALDRLKPAARAVRQLQLAAEFPTVEALYRQRSLARLMNKRLWPVALSYAGSDVSLQVIAGAVGRLTEPDTAGQPQTAPRKQPSKLQP
jgi:hypothetical protein